MEAADEIRCSSLDSDSITITWSRLSRCFVRKPVWQCCARELWTCKFSHWLKLLRCFPVYSMFSCNPLSQANYLSKWLLKSSMTIVADVVYQEAIYGWLRFMCTCNRNCTVSWSAVALAPLCWCWPRAFHSWLAGKFRIALAPAPRSGVTIPGWTILYTGWFYF
jgi:hypothetical protein